jgi:hypothetical protein
VACTFNLVPCPRHQPMMVLNWPKQAPSTNIRWPHLALVATTTRLSHNIHNIHQNEIRSTPCTQCTPQGKSSHSSQYHQRNRSRQGISPELLNHHHPHGIQRSHRANLPSISWGSLMANPDPPNTSSNQPSHHITRHICNNDGSKCKQAGRQYISVSAKLGSQ